MEQAAQLISEVLAKSVRENPSSITGYSHQRTCSSDVLLRVQAESERPLNTLMLKNHYSHKCI